MGTPPEPPNPDPWLSAAHARAVLDQAFDSVVTMNAEGDIVGVNPAAERTFGHSAEALVGRELAEVLIPPALREHHRRGLHRHLEGGRGRVEGRRVETTGLRADGSEFPVELAVRRLDTADPPLFIGFLRDLSRRNATEFELRRLADEQAALRRVATLVASGADSRRVMAAVTEEVGRLLDAQTANMIRYEDPRTATVVGGWSSDSVRNMPVGTILTMDGRTAARLVFDTGRPARVESFDDIEGTLAAALRELGFRSAVAAPVVLEGRLWGAVLVSTVHPEPFPAGVEARLGGFAELMGQALTNAATREQLAASRARIVEAGDAERRRLERNLHDGAQQRLVSVALMLRHLEGLAERDPGATRTGLSTAGEELGHALAELRELARGLHPAVLSEHGLAAALAALTGRGPIPVGLEVELDERPREQVEAAAYFVVSEALANVARYAQAGFVRVTVTRRDTALVVEIADDGVGGADPDAGSGLRGLGDRVEALGGRIELESPAGAGTTVRAVLPWR
jgi:PAS domain S-box-containing protein